MSEVRSTSGTGGQKGVKLERYDLIPVNPLKTLATLYGLGARKYSDHQWRKGYEWSKSYSALQRHANEFWAGKDLDSCSNDPEGCRHTPHEGQLEVESFAPDACYNHTGVHHMAAVAWHAFVLLEFSETHPDHDDRHEALKKFIEDFDYNQYTFSFEGAHDPQESKEN